MHLESNTDIDPDMKTQPEQSVLKETINNKFYHIVKDDTIKHVTLTDLTPSGKYRQGYLVLTNKKIFTVYDKEGLLTENKPQPDTEINLKDIQDIWLEKFVGNGILVIETDEKTYKMVRFSLTFIKAFEEAADNIKELSGIPLRKDSTSDSEGHSPHQRERCPECGTVIRRGVCPNCLEKGKLLKRLLKYMLPYLPQAIVSFIMLLMTGGLSLVQPALTGILVDEVLVVEDLFLLSTLVIALGAVHLSSAAITGARTYIMTKIGQGIIRDLRSEVFHHLQYLNMQFFDSVRTGAIMSRTTSDTRNLQRFITQSTQNILQRAVMLVGISVMLFTYDPWLAIVTLAPMPLVVLGTRLFTRKIHRIYRRIWVRRALMNSVIADSIPGIKVVKSFAQEEQEIGKFDHRSEQVYDQHVNAGKFRSIFRPFVRFSTSLGTLIIWGYGGYLVITTDRLSPGDLVAFLYYVNQFYNPLRQIFQFTDVIQEAATAATRVFEILDTEPEISEKEDKVVLEEVEGEIEFKDVHFSYEAHEPVLKNINVKIKKGEMVGLVGSSGAGKTTMANLIPRLYDVTSGKITIDGHDIRDLHLKTLRDQIGVVLQDPTLFHGTIAENIAYGHPDVSLEEIIWAAQAANAHDFIMEFPDGYDTHTGERGLRLSGGQKQRISIARAILKNPKILILDEATSSVDTETEKLIQQAIDRLIENRTTIAIAHRLSTLQNADKLLVLEDGEVIEEGSHEELMKKDGVFAKLIKLQSEAAKIRAL